MLRKHVLTDLPAAPRISKPDPKDISALATAFVTSEAPDHPIDMVFDSSRGPGGTRWIAAADGEQTLMLVFDTPQTIREISVETEEPQVNRTQVLCISSRTMAPDISRTDPPGSHIQPPEHQLRARGMVYACPASHPPAGGDPARQGRRPWPRDANLLDDPINR
jgi:hypothetical protein